MKIGVVFPQTELGGDAGAVRAYGEAADSLGYTHLVAYDHVVGAEVEVEMLAVVHERRREEPASPWFLRSAVRPL